MVEEVVDAVQDLDLPAAGHLDFLAEGEGRLGGVEAHGRFDQCVAESRSSAGRRGPRPPPAPLAASRTETKILWRIVRSAGVGGPRPELQRPQIGVHRPGHGPAAAMAQHHQAA